MADGLIPGDDPTIASIGWAALWNQDGDAPGVGSFDRRVGMQQTAPSLSWGLTTTSVGDQLKLLDELLDSHALIGRAARRFALGLMENVTPSQAWGVSGGVPAGVSIALKNGWLPFGAGSRPRHGTSGPSAPAGGA